MDGKAMDVPTGFLNRWSLVRSQPGAMVFIGCNSVYQKALASTRPNHHNPTRRAAIRVKSHQITHECVRYRLRTRNEAETLRERIQSGLAEARRKGIKIGRP